MPSRAASAGALYALGVAAAPRQIATSGAIAIEVSADTCAVPNLHDVISKSIYQQAIAPPTRSTAHSAMTPTTSFDKSAIVEALQTELVNHAPSNTPCAALMLLRLPQLLQSAEAELEPSDGWTCVPALAVAFAVRK